MDAALDAVDADLLRALIPLLPPRNLRAVLEESMLDVMYDIPSRLDVIGCTISNETVKGEAPPLLTFRGEREKRKKEA